MRLPGYVGQWIIEGLAPFNVSMDLLVKRSCRYIEKSQLNLLHTSDLKPHEMEYSVFNSAL